MSHVCYQLGRGRKGLMLMLYFVDSEGFDGGSQGKVMVKEEEKMMTTKKGYNRMCLMFSRQEI